MTAAVLVPARSGGRTSWWWAWGALILTGVVLYAYEDHWAWLVNYPKQWIVPLRFWISDFMKWLINDFDLGLFTFKQLTRSIAWVLEWPLRFAESALASGFTFSTDPSAPVLLNRISWVAIIVLLVVAAYRTSGSGLAILVGLCFFYLASFGQWESAMVTLSSIVIAVPLGIAVGLGIGIVTYRHPALERFIIPLLDLMQTVPVFAYLVPVLFLFGFGPVAAMIATMIYATPPMIRVTVLALKQVGEELVEYGTMAGCTKRQMLWKVQIPAARNSLMVGVNQVIMLSLNMVIIASMIGAGGLGFDVLGSLRRLAIGSGLEAGLAITLLAIAIDRLTQAIADKPPPGHAPERLPFLRRHFFLTVAVATLIVTWLLGSWWSFFDSYPEHLTMTTSGFWDSLVKWINVNFFDQLEAIKTFLLLNLMIPFKRFLLEIPWVIVVAAVGLAGFRLGGARLAIQVMLLAGFIAVVGLWQKAMITLYLCGISVMFAALIGIPVGIWAAGNPRVNRVVQVVIDTLQTLPSFVYLIPVVMLFRVGDFSAMLAVIAYSLAPAIRYTILGIKQVPEHLVEAAGAMGCTRRQIRWRVQLPIALPEMMLGINQTIMMALSMLVITALVGTRDLGQEVYIALTKADTGRGLVAGVCVAFIAIIADRLISAWARHRKKELGIAV